MISVVCPFYNEEAVIEGSLRLMLRNLATLEEDWELLVVDDGSRDGSLAIAKRLEAEDRHLRVLGYPVNHGRGYAIRHGAASARGEVLVTTEIDSSWGDDIVHRLVAELARRKDADIVIASPHLEGGGYKNVPAARVFLSSLGNYVIRSGLTYGITMNTGMTRAYRREKFLALPLYEDEKEMHLEVVSKALAFGYTIVEIPAVLEWKTHKLTARPGQKRPSAFRVGRLVRTHLLFSLLAAPFRWLYGFAAVLGLVSGGFFVASVASLLTRRVAVYLFLSSLSFALFALLLVGIAVLAQQGRELQRDLWRVQSELRRPRS